MPKKVAENFLVAQVSHLSNDLFQRCEGEISQKTFESIAGINRDTQLQLLSCRDWTYQQMPETYVRLFQKTSPPNDDHLTNRKKVEGGLIPVVNGL